MDFIEEIKQEFDPQFKAVNDQAEELAERLEGTPKTDNDAVKALTDQIVQVEERAKTLEAERDQRLNEEQMKALSGRVGDLTEVIANLQNADHSDFALPQLRTEDSQKSLWGEGTDFSFYGDAYGAIKNGNQQAIERWAEAMPGKAMTEGTGSAGGYLVPDQISSELLELREQQSVLRPLFSSLQVTSDTLRIPSVTGGLVAGWVAELAEKPVGDLTFGEISANVFTKAGLAVVSNQLLRDAKPGIDGLINRDLAKRLAALEEIAFINGSGTGQPRGILNTAGVNTVALTTTPVLDLLDAIVQAITDIFSTYFAAPNAIVMHPRTWARIVKARESATASTYIVGPPAAGQGRRSNQGIPGYTSAPPRGELFGFPVYTTANVPTNLGGTTNESRVIVGNFDEGLILDREGISLDSSEHVYFSTNQTIFRAEDCVGFTAARYPKAFSVIGGAGLAAG